MEYLREGIHLRAMAQKDPLVEYRGEGHVMFEELGRIIHDEVVRYLFHVEMNKEEAAQLEAEPEPEPEPDQNLVYEHESLSGAEAIAAAGGGATAGAATATALTAAAPAAPAAQSLAPQPQRLASEYDKVGRNDLCPCGSGRKFKKCHGS